MKNLKELREYLNSIPNINEGGCLISAYSMYLYLKKTNQLPSNFKILQIAEPILQRFLLIRQLQSTDPTKFTGGLQHAMCLVDGVIFDSKEARPLDIDLLAKTCSIPVDPETQSEYIIAQINTAGWNTSFNREKFVPEIEKELGIDLSFVKLFFTHLDKVRAQNIIESEDNRITSEVINYRKALSHLSATSFKNIDDEKTENALVNILG